MHSFLLTLHSLVRWVALIFGVLAAGRALIGWRGKIEWKPLDSQFGLLFTIGMDIQLLLGLLLYFFFSPITTNAFADFGAAMSNTQVRFFLVEHLFLMLAAVVLAHVGRALSKRAAEAAQKHQKAALFFTLAVVAMLIAIPWSRPLFRLGG